MTKKVVYTEIWGTTKFLHLPAIKHVCQLYLTTAIFVLQYYPNSGTRGRRDGSGSTEATEMILNNLFYITVKVRRVLKL